MAAVMVQVATVNLAGPQCINPWEFRRRLANEGLQRIYDTVLADVDEVRGKTLSVFTAEMLDALMARFERPSDAVRAFARSLQECDLHDMYCSKFIAESRLVSLFDRCCNVLSDRTTFRPTVICGRDDFDFEAWLSFVFDGEEAFYPDKLTANTNKEYPAFPKSWEADALQYQVVTSCIFDAVVSHIVHEAARLQGFSRDDVNAVIADLTSTTDYNARTANLVNIVVSLAKKGRIVTLCETPYDVYSKLPSAVGATHRAVCPTVLKPNDTQATVMLVPLDVDCEDVSEEVHQKVCAYAQKMGVATPKAKSIVAIRNKADDRVYVGFHAKSDGSTMVPIMATVGEMEAVVAMGDANCFEEKSPGKLSRDSLLALAAKVNADSTYVSGVPTMNRWRTAVGAQPLKASKRADRECKDGVLVTKGTVSSCAVVNRLDGTCDDMERPTTAWPIDHYAVIATLDVGKNA